MSQLLKFQNFCRLNNLWVHYSRHGIFKCFNRNDIREHGYICGIGKDFKSWKSLPSDVKHIFLPHRDDVKTSGWTLKPSNVTWFSQGDWLSSDSCSSTYDSILVGIRILPTDNRFLHIYSDEDMKEYVNCGMFDFEYVQRETSYAGVLFYRNDYGVIPRWKSVYEVPSCVIWDITTILESGSTNVYLIQL